MSSRKKLKMVALLLFLPFDCLTSLYMVSATCGRFQGGIVPSCAMIVREYFPPSLLRRSMGAPRAAVGIG